LPNVVLITTFVTIQTLLTILCPFPSATRDAVSFSGVGLDFSSNAFCAIHHFGFVLITTFVTIQTPLTILLPFPSATRDAISFSNVGLDISSNAFCAIQHSGFGGDFARGTFKTQRVQRRVVKSFYFACGALFAKSKPE
jgi:hypothetical protein